MFPTAIPYTSPILLRNIPSNIEILKFLTPFPPVGVYYFTLKSMTVIEKWTTSLFYPTKAVNDTLFRVVFTRHLMFNFNNFLCGDKTLHYVNNIKHP